jgi:anti-sigma-K factor RskA
VSDERVRPDNGGAGCAGNAAPYVLGALSDAEYAAFTDHLRTCAVCREEVAALQTVAAALPAAVPARRAPAALKRRVMADVHADAKQRSAARRSRELPTSRVRWRPLIAPLAAAALFALLLAVLVSGGGGGANSRTIRAEVLARGASGFVRVSSGHAELTLAGMPQPSPGRVYELWIKRAGAPTPTDALFTVSSGGAATVGVPGSLAGVRAVLVTSEPLGGSRVPTRAPAVIASLD